MRRPEGVPPFTFNQPQSSYPYAPSLPRQTRQATDNEKRPFDFLSRLEQKLAQYNASESLLKRWLFEILSVITSAACMGAIIGILCYLQDRSLSTWPLGLTIITVLSKVASAALILPISEAIGQLKWTWFHGKSRDAFDFEIFDKASRGAWGSFMLLCRTKGRSLAALGALLTVSLLAIDTFFQQVTDLPERWVLQGESFIPRSIRYKPKYEPQYDNTWDNIPVSQMNQELRKALYYYYYANGTEPTKVGNATQAEVPLVCPTSRCEWPSYETLAVCSACEDVSHMLEYACLTMRMDWTRNSTGPSTEKTWPNGTACGYFLNATSNDPVLMTGFRIENDTIGETLLMRTLPLATNPARHALYGTGSINFNHIQYPMLDAIIVSAVNGSVDNVYNKMRPVAHECMLSFCVKTFRSAYNSGGYVEHLENTFFNSTITPWPWKTEYWAEEDYTLVDFAGEINIRPPTSKENSSAFGISNDTFVDFGTALDEVFPSMLTVSNPTAKPFIKIRTSFTRKVMFREVNFSPWLSPNNITHHMERIAQAMTNVMRSDTNSNEVIAGTAYARETYVQIHWGWMAFPLLMLLLSIVFLAATMYKTSSAGHNEIGIWKTSAMPTLLYGLPKKTQMDVMSDTPARGVPGKGSSKVRIRLQPKQGWRVSGASNLTQSPPLPQLPQIPRPAVHAPHGWI